VGNLTGGTICDCNIFHTPGHRSHCHGHAVGARIVSTAPMRWSRIAASAPLCGPQVENKRDRGSSVLKKKRGARLGDRRSDRRSLGDNGV
jgi:hypothetical protein